MIEKKKSDKKLCAKSTHRNPGECIVFNGTQIRVNEKKKKRFLDYNDRNTGKKKKILGKIKKKKCAKIKKILKVKQYPTHTVVQDDDTFNGFEFGYMCVGVYLSMMMIETTIQKLKLYRKKKTLFYSLLEKRKLVQLVNKKKKSETK